MIRAAVAYLFLLICVIPLQVNAQGKICKPWEVDPKVDGVMASFKCAPGLFKNEDDGFSDCTANVQLTVITKCQPPNGRVRVKCFLNADSYVQQDAPGRVKSPNKEIAIGYSDVHVSDKRGAGTMDIRLGLTSTYLGKIYRVKPTDLTCNENK